MITYQMPQGVEHKLYSLNLLSTCSVITYQMPQGVEHWNGTTIRDCRTKSDYLSDAARR